MNHMYRLAQTRIKVYCKLHLLQILPLLRQNGVYLAPLKYTTVLDLQLSNLERMVSSS
jgi:hypothetical protein